MHRWKVSILQRWPGPTSAESLAVPSIPFVQDHQFRYGVIETVAPGIRRLTARNAGVFTYHGTGTYIVGTGEVAVIDPGPDDPEHIRALIHGLQGERISHILITHCHQDHSPGARQLQAACGAPTFAFGPHGTKAEPGAIAAEEGVDTEFSPDVRLVDGQRLAIGDCEVECLHTPGHTSNHMCFALTGPGTLFSGDHVMAWSTSVIIPPDGNMADYLASLTALLKREDTGYWPTHGPPLDNPHDYIEALIAHRHQRMTDILQLLEIAPHHITQMIPPLYPELDTRLYQAASRSIFASVLYLIEAGEIETSDNATLNSTYHRTR